MASVLVLGSFTQASLAAATSRKPSPESAGAGHRPAVDCGFLIVDSRYIAPPYLVEHDGERLLINGVAMGTAGAAARYQESLEFGFGPGTHSRRGARGMLSAPEPLSPGRYMIVEVQRLLIHGSLIISFPDGTVCSFPHGETMVRMLLSDAERLEKLRFFMSNSRYPITLAQWGDLLDEFQADSGLSERMVATGPAVETSANPVLSPSRYTLYSLTVLGMVLTVMSFGIVLSHRPQHFCRWSDVNRIPRDVRLVVGCATMIAILCVFDLACTLAASHATSFWELNPFGASLASQPLTLLAVKLLITFACVAILWNLRFYRGTQLASWWLCLGLTLLAARWVVFNSLMLA
ncbi:MAG: DUF5658 family protein [Patescibacteria group bacterium]|nr:DUF5658 family protein [Patescibacteria group bacterium]